MKKRRLKGASMFSGAGIGEHFFAQCGIDMLVASEIIEKRAKLYQTLYPTVKMIQGDITNENIFEQFIKETKNSIDFLIASPPCQGMSVVGKSRNQKTMVKDERNYLIFQVFKVIQLQKPTYILIENVPSLLKVKLLYNNELISIMDLFCSHFGHEYDIDSKVLNAANYGVPQNRLRAIIKMNKKGNHWPWPIKDEHTITVENAIGHLPSLESGEKSDIRWHFARKHTDNNILWMQHTPTGESAFSNERHFPIKNDGTRITGYESSYRRIRWDEPAPTITIRNDCIASQRNVHPGRVLESGLYSDARVLTPLELMILNSLPCDWNIPIDTPELLIRQCIGESIPPLLLKRIVAEISDE